MAEPRLLIDSDILVLLAGAGLLDRAIALLGFSRPCSFRLPALPHMLARGRRFAQLDGRTRTLALEACESTPEIPDRPGDAVFEQLLAFPEIDEGEALLYALLADQPAHMLASGDKPAMQAVGSAPELRDIRDRIAGRVICLETVLRLLVVHDGAAAVARCFAVFPDHKTLQVVFSPVNSGNQEACLAALDSYLGDLKRTVGADFLCEP